MQRLIYSLVCLLLASPCWGAAPTVVLDIPTPTATRTSPCPVHAGIDIASSSTGDSSSWDQCRIMWQLEADGSALTNWPSKYRYVTDPRPGLNSKQIDLAGQTDTSNFNRPRGFNFGWVLTAGTWRIKCTVTNPEGSSTTTTSSDITIAADSRTEYTVQASGGDYTTLAAALTARAATDDIAITIEDGHTETITAALTTVSGDNFVIRQAGTGTRPNISWDGSGNANLLVLTGENHVVDGLQFTETTGDNANNVADVNLVAIQAPGAIVNCLANGSSAGNYFREIFQVTGTHDGNLLLNCSCPYSERFSVSWGTGAQTIQSIIGGSYGASRDESTIRTTGSPDFVNTCWTDLLQDGLKSTLRYGSRNYLHAYGNKWEDGDNWCGIITGGGIAASNVRIEANYATGSVSATGIIMGVKSGLSDATACNNVAYEGPVQLYLGFEADSFGDPKVNCRWLHNTLWYEDGRNKAYVFGRETVGDSTFGSGNAVSCNLFGHADGADLTGRASQLSDDIVAFVDNVFPATTPNAIALMEAFDSSGSPTIYDTAAEINAGETWASGNTEKDVTLDASYVPSDPTSVTTASGVYDDYFGTARSSTSWAGAVGSEPVSESQGLFNAFIPGVLIQQP